jgi:hypothetical protein
MKEEQRHCREIAVRHHVTIMNEHVRLWIRGDDSEAKHVDNDVKTLAETFLHEREQARLEEPMGEKVVESAILCPVCQEPQRKVPSGVVCKNGHGF